MSEPIKHGKHPYNFRYSVVVFAICLFATCVLTWVMFENIKAERKERFEKNVFFSQQEITDSIQAYMIMLRATKGFFMASEQVTREEFRTYIERLRLEKEYSGLQGIGYAVRIKAEEREEFTAHMKEAGLEKFHIRPEGDRPVYYSVVFLEPLDTKNGTVIGYDMFSEPARRAAMESARDSGEMAATGKVALGQGGDTEDAAAGFLIYLPIYTLGTMPQTPQERRALLQGFVYSPFHARNFFEHVFETEPAKADFVVYEGDRLDEASLLYRAPQKIKKEESFFGNNLSIKSKLVIAGHEWTILFTPDGDFNESMARLVLLIIFLGGVLISIIMAWLTHRGEQARRALAVSEERFRTVFNIQFQFMALLSPDGIVLDVNDFPLNVADLKREDIIGEYFWNCGWFTNLPKARKIWPKRLEEAALSDKPVIKTDEYEACNGEVRMADSAVTAVRDSEGDIAFFIIQAHDITERERAQEDLREETQTLEDMNRLMRSMASTLDLESLVQQAVDEARELSGAKIGAFFYNVTDDAQNSYMLYTVSGVSKKGFKDFPMSRETALFDPVFRDEATLRIDDLLKDPRCGNKTYKALPERHSMRSFLAVPVISRNGDVLGGLFFGHPKPDIFTQRSVQIVEGIAAQAAIGIDNARLYEEITQSEERYRQMALRAEAANEAKSEFLANMSHEIRTPMNVIIGLSDILSSEGVSAEKRKQMFATLRTSSRQLMELINDLLDIARIESRGFEMQKRAFNIADVIRETVELQQVRAEEKGVRLKFGNIDDGGKEYQIGDPLRVRQVLLNIIGNAVKFTEDGEIEVSCRYKKTKTGKIETIITVSDTGIGIPEDKLGSIFDKFSQADNSITRKYGGSGLGLSISKQLAERMGGHIEVESELGKGSVFTIHLKLPAVAEKETDTNAPKKKPVKIPQKSKTTRILLVDDHEPNILVASHMLEGLGYGDPVIAHTGKEALDRTEKDDFDVVLMDIQMPGIDGLTATRMIRERESENNLEPVKIIGVTAHAFAEDRQKCLRSGMDGYLAKPFRIEELKNAIKAVL